MINIKEYLMTRGNEERRVYHIVKNGRIDLLQQIFPNAETLVAKTENCREFGYDVMANLADDGNTGMLKKILSAYFSENTEENNALKRRFLLSHRINGTPKDFHHFIRFLSPREQEQAKFEQMECSDIDEIVFQQQKLKRGVFPPDLRSKKDRRRAEFYYLLRDEYQNSLPLKNPHEKMPTARLGIAPKGVSAVEIKGYVGSPEEKNAAEFRSWQETYPRFRLTKIPEDQQPDQPLCCRTEDLPAIPYRPGRYDLAKEAFRQMHFPDLWFNDHYFHFLYFFDRSYQDLHDNDPVVSASFKNFNENGHFFSVENRIDPTASGNSLAGVKYSAYSSDDYICLLSQTAPMFMTSLLLHELAHDTDKSNNFCCSDIYVFSASLMAAHPEHSIPRTRAVNETRRYYPASEFEKESLARIAEAGVSASLDQKDKLLGAIYKMFSAYGNAQLNQESAVLNRIKLCARLRLPGRPGYHKFDEAAKACRHMHILSDHYRNMADGILYDRSATPPPCSREKLQEAENKFKESCKQLQGSGYSIVGGKDVSYLIAEKEIIKCIEAELRDIEKIRKNPLAAKVVLGLDTVSRDNITDDTPLELLAAEEFSRAQKFYAARIKVTPNEKMREELKFRTDACRNIMENLKNDAKEGMPFDRALFQSGITRTVYALTFAEKVAERYFPDYQPQPFDINRCLPQTEDNGTIRTGTEAVLENIGNLEANIGYITTDNPDLRLSAEIIGTPYSNTKGILESAEKLYKRKLERADKNDPEDGKLEAIGDMLEQISQSNSNLKRNILSDMRTMQLIYRELHPDISRLPDDLQFSGLTADSFASSDQNTPAPARQNLQKYCRQLLQTTAGQDTAVRPAARGYGD